MVCMSHEVYLCTVFAIVEREKKRWRWQGKGHAWVWQCLSVPQLPFLSLPSHAGLHFTLIGIQWWMFHIWLHQSIFSEKRERGKLGRIQLFHYDNLSVHRLTYSAEPGYRTESEERGLPAGVAGVKEWLLHLTNTWISTSISHTKRYPKEGKSERNGEEAKLPITWCTVWKMGAWMREKGWGWDVILIHERQTRWRKCSIATLSLCHQPFYPFIDSCM